MKLPDVWHELKDMVLGTGLSDAVRAAAPLLAEFGVSFRVVGWRLVQGQSEHVRLAFERDPVGVVLPSIAPLGHREDVSLGRLSRREGFVRHYATVNAERTVHLSTVLQVLAPGVPESARYPRRLWRRGMIPGEVGRQLSLTVEHCRSLLEGDVAQWSTVREKEQYGFGAKQMEGETRDEYITRLRETALAALRSGDFWRANRFYNWLALVVGRISLLDRIRWWRASRHIFLIR